MTGTPLSEREQEILQLVATGASNKEISQKLYISVNTVKVHLRNIYSKLEVASRTEAAMWAVQNGLVDGGGQVTADSKAAEESDNPQGNDDIQHWYDIVPRRIRPWLLGGVALLLILAGVGINLLWQGTQATPTPDGLPSASDVEQSRWQRLADMPTARAGLAAAAYDNRIYAIVGEGVDGPVGANERYDPMTDTWEILTPKPVPVADVHAGVIGGRIFIPGGRLSNGEMTDILEIYDPQSDTWSRGASVPVAVSGYALATFEGKLYLFGGWDGEDYLSTVYIYDPGRNEWASGTAMLTARAFAGAAVAGGKLYIIGGIDEKRVLIVNEEYLPNHQDGDGNNTPQRRAPLPQARFGMDMVSLADIIYVIGGEGESSSVLVNLQYLARQDEWRPLTETPVYLGVRFGVTPLGSDLFILGGKMGEDVTAHAAVYRAVYSIAIPVVR